MRETSGSENVFCFDEVGPGAAEPRRTNEIIYSACTPEMARHAKRRSKREKDARSILSHYDPRKCRR